MVFKKLIIGFLHHGLLPLFLIILMRYYGETSHIVQVIVIGIGFLISCISDIIVVIDYHKDIIKVAKDEL